MTSEQPEDENKVTDGTLKTSTSEDQTADELFAALMRNAQKAVGRYRGLSDIPVEYFSQGTSE